MILTLNKSVHKGLDRKENDKSVMHYFDSSLFLFTLFK